MIFVKFSSKKECITYRLSLNRFTMSHCIDYCIPTRFVAKRFSLSEDRCQLARKRATPPVLQAIKKKVSPSGLILLCAMKEEPRASYDPVHRKFIPLSSPPPHSVLRDRSLLLPSLNRECIPRFALFSGYSTHFFTIKNCYG